jgi:hypothetical protein
MVESAIVGVGLGSRPEHAPVTLASTTRERPGRPFGVLDTTLRTFCYALSFKESAGRRSRWQERSPVRLAWAARVTRSWARGLEANDYAEIVRLRIFEGDAGKMNRSVLDGRRCAGRFPVHIVWRRARASDHRLRRRPAAKGAGAMRIFRGKIRAAGLRCETGRFREMMAVER